MATLPAIDHDLKFGVAEEPRILNATFGDGYSQRAPDGINNISMEIQLVWSFIPLADLNTLLAFFRARNGSESFDFELPQEAAPRKWLCKDWNADTIAAGVYTLSASLKEVHDQ